MGKAPKLEKLSIESSGAMSKDAQHAEIAYPAEELDLDTVIPEDAPETSIAHEKFSKPSKDSLGNDLFVCIVKGAGGETVRFQVTAKAAGGSTEAAARIARLCYVKLV